MKHTEDSEHHSSPLKKEQLPRVPQHSPEDLSTSSSRLSEGGRSDEERDEEEGEDIQVDNESDEEMRHDIADPIPCYPNPILHGHHAFHPSAPPPPSASLPGSWPPFNFLHHQLALRAFESKFMHRYLGQ